MSKRYVLVEVETSGAAEQREGDNAETIRRALGHYFHNSPRRFRTTDVSDLVFAGLCSCPRGGCEAHHDAS